MPDPKPYRLTMLLSPQAKDARGAAQALVGAWAKEKGAAVQGVRAEERKLWYPVRQQREATYLHVTLQAAPESIADLFQRLRLEKAVMRHAAYADEAPAGKRLKDVPFRRPETGSRPPDLKTVAPKEKAPLEKLEEKIDEILKEEVL